MSDIDSDCMVCGCSLPNGVCTTVAKMKPLDEAALPLLEEAAGQQFSSDRGAHFGLLNYPIIKEQMEEEAARLAAVKLAQVGKPKAGSENTKNVITWNLAALEGRALYFLFWLLKATILPGFPFSFKIEGPEAHRQILNSFLSDVGESDGLKRTVITTQRDQVLLVHITIGPRVDKSDRGTYSHSSWIFEVNNNSRFIIRNSYVDSSGSDRREWILNL